MQFNFKMGSLLNLVYFELWTDFAVSFKELCFRKNPCFVLNGTKMFLTWKVIAAAMK